MRWILAILIVVGIGVGVIFFNAERIDSPPAATAPDAPTPERAPSPAPDAARDPDGDAPPPPARRRALLYFLAADGPGLRPEPRDVPRSPSLRDAVRQVVEALILGPRTGLVETVPRNAKVLEVFLDGQGTAYIDFSKELAADHPKGVASEMATVASIVQTVTANFESIRKVAILIDGNGAETLAGHVDIRRPLARLDVRSPLGEAGAAPPTDRP